MVRANTTKSIYTLTPENLSAELKSAKFPAFRSKQMLDWLYKKRVTEWDQMLNLPKQMRSWLNERFSLVDSKHIITNQAGDITEKLLIELSDTRYIETVLIRYPQKGVGQEDSRNTVCVSSQVGCAYGCKFCASGLDGWKRHLTQGEILSQLIHVCKLEETRTPEIANNENLPFDNIVFMGMGEPLANYDAIVGTIRTLNSEWGMNFGARRITISTCGLVPQMLRLAEEPIQFRLAISLHGASNESRSQIMPINRKYPLEELIPAAEAFSQKHGRMLTLEFILIKDVNDSLTEAKRLSKIAKRLHAHVNLIPYNTVEGLDWERPNLARQQAFAEVLKSENISHTIRKEKGHSIDAACGQLRLRKERKNRKKFQNKGHKVTKETLRRKAHSGFTDHLIDIS
jgi:23S rRNA (adenine2503-C2)-methyltransferase